MALGGQVAGQGEVAAWLWGIAIRRLISGLRRTSRTALVVALVPAPEPSVPSAEEAALLAVEYGDVGAALSTLSPELRAVIQLTVLDGLSDRDTARALGLPLGTAKGRIRRAKKDWAWALRFWVGAFGLSVVALVVATSEGAALPRAGRSRVT